MMNCNAVGWGAIINRTDNSCLSADNPANNNHHDEIDDDGQNGDDGKIKDDDDDDDDGGGSIPCSWWLRQLTQCNSDGPKTGGSQPQFERGAAANDYCGQYWDGWPLAHFVWYQLVRAGPVLVVAQCGRPSLGEEQLQLVQQPPNCSAELKIGRARKANPRFSLRIMSGSLHISSILPSQYWISLWNFVVRCLFCVRCSFHWSLTWNKCLEKNETAVRSWK